MPLGCGQPARGSGAPGGLPGRGRWASGCVLRGGRRLLLRRAAADGPEGRAAAARCPPSSAPALDSGPLRGQSRGTDAWRGCERSGQPSTQQGPRDSFSPRQAHLLKHLTLCGQDPELSQAESTPPPRQSPARAGRRPPCVLPAWLDPSLHHTASFFW